MADASSWQKRPPTPLGPTLRIDRDHDRQTDKSGVQGRGGSVFFSFFGEPTPTPADMLFFTMLEAPLSKATRYYRRGYDSCRRNGRWFTFWTEAFSRTAAYTTFYNTRVSWKKDIIKWHTPTQLNNGHGLELSLNITILVICSVLIWRTPIL